MVVQFLLLSLKRENTDFCEWRLNREGIAEAYDRFREALVETYPFDGDALFVRGEQSNYVLPEHESAIAALFPRYRLETIANTGHWLHAEQPKLFNELVLEFLR